MEADGCLSERKYATFPKTQTFITRSLVSVLSQLNPARNHPPCFLKIYINTIHNNSGVPRGVWGFNPSPPTTTTTTTTRNSEVLPKLSRIRSSVEYTSVTT
jgi:hypothetical protein